MMTPIHRIPLDGEHTLAEAVDLERHTAKGTIVAALRDALEHCQDDQHLTVMLDWAAQIRDQMGISWEESIGVAMTMYFG